MVVRGSANVRRKNTMEFDFNSFSGLFPEEPKKEKKIKKSEPAKKKNTSKKERKTAKKSGIPENILNVTFLKDIKLFTSFGAVELSGEDEFTSATIKERLLQESLFKEVVSDHVVLVSGGVENDKEIVFAAADQNVTSLEGVNSDSDVDIVAGGYAMHLLKETDVSAEMENWPEWMRGGQFYKATDQVYGVLGKEIEQLPDTLIGYEDYGKNAENDTAEELLCAIAGIEKLPQNIKVSFAGTKEEGFIQILYAGPGASTGMAVHEAKTETNEEREKRLLEEAVVKLPATVELPWGGGCQQKIAPEDFEGKTEVNLSTILAKLECVYTLLGNTVKYHAVYIPQQDLVHISMLDSGMRQKGSLCPF